MSRRSALGRDSAANAWIAPGGLLHPPTEPDLPLSGHPSLRRMGYPWDIHFSTLIVGFLHPFSGVICFVPTHRLPSFAMWPAFPTSDYYEGSAPRPALAAGWPTPLPESWTRIEWGRRRQWPDPPAGLRHPPHRTGRATFTTSGSPSGGLDLCGSGTSAFPPSSSGSYIPPPA